VHLEEHGTIDGSPDVDAYRKFEGQNDPYTNAEARERIRQLYLDAFQRKIESLIPACLSPF
jgi:hypothetical protein